MGKTDWLLIFVGTAQLGVGWCLGALYVLQRAAAKRTQGHIAATFATPGKRPLLTVGERGWESSRARKSK